MLVNIICDVVDFAIDDGPNHLFSYFLGSLLWDIIVFSDFLIDNVVNLLFETQTWVGNCSALRASRINRIWSFEGWHFMKTNLFWILLHKESKICDLMMSPKLGQLLLLWFHRSFSGWLGLLFLLFGRVSIYLYKFLDNNLWHGLSLLDCEKLVIWWMKTVTMLFMKQLITFGEFILKFHGLICSLLIFLWARFHFLLICFSFSIY